MIGIGLGMGLFNPPRAAFSIAVAEPDRAGMASEINETFQQVGVAVGIAAFGAMLQSRVQEAFLTTPLASALGDRDAEGAEAVAAGGFREVAATLPVELQGELVTAAQASLLDGLHAVMIACGIVATLGTIAAFTGIRRQDLRDDPETDDVMVDDSAVSIELVRS